SAATVGENAKAFVSAWQTRHGASTPTT
ncbi:2-dehydro-3-deoxy-6-phosphogalactonate aldolase, partial [Herbaspirillum sp. 3C11]